ncbi:unnamed protein product [Pieris brassicae]|uniref:Uncharacterized protein n=1 Tax=Pieris brassicae TaxID=7116 RepID=A0A9P0TPG6_PIEBR|nr:unnamed protein product [Pieris brassicae]
MSTFGDDESINPSSTNLSAITDEEYDQFYRENRTEYLSDYSLNSPLISDEVEEFRKKISELLDLTQEDSSQTFEVVRAFITGWLNKEQENPNKACYPTAIKKWGAYFLDLHIATLILNALDDAERSESSKLRGKKAFIGIPAKSDLPLVEFRKNPCRRRIQFLFRRKDDT